MGRFDDLADDVVFMPVAAPGPAAQEADHDDTAENADDLP